MAVSEEELQIITGFELRELPPHTTSLSEEQVKELVHKAVVLKRTAHYIVSLAAATLPAPRETPTPPRPTRRGRIPVTEEKSSTSRGAEMMIAGGIVYSYQAEGVSIALDILAPRGDNESWFRYIQGYTDVPEA